jgi:hypothetical protein
METSSGPAVEFSKRSPSALARTEQQLESWSARDKESRRIVRGVCGECHNDVFTDQHREFHDDFYFHRECYARKAACMFLAALQPSQPEDQASPADDVFAAQAEDDRATRNLRSLVPAFDADEAADDDHAGEHEAAAEDEHEEAAQDKHADEHVVAQDEHAEEPARTDNVAMTVQDVKPRGDSGQAALQDGIQDDHPACAIPFERTNSALVDEADVIRKLQSALSLADLKELGHQKSALRLHTGNVKQAREEQRAQEVLQREVDTVNESLPLLQSLYTARGVREEQRVQDVLQQELDTVRKENMTLSRDLATVRGEKERALKDRQSAVKELVRCQMHLQQARRAAQLVCDELHGLDMELAVTREEANELPKTIISLLHIADEGVQMLAQKTQEVALTEHQAVHLAQAQETQMQHLHAHIEQLKHHIQSQREELEEQREVLSQDLLHMEQYRQSISGQSH